MHIPPYPKDEWSKLDSGTWATRNSTQRYDRRVLAHELGSNTRCLPAKSDVGGIFVDFSLERQAAVVGQKGQPVIRGENGVLEALQPPLQSDKSLRYTEDSGGRDTEDHGEMHHQYIASWRWAAQLCRSCDMVHWRLAGRLSCDGKLLFVLQAATASLNKAYVHCTSLLSKHENKCCPSRPLHVHRRYPIPRLKQNHTTCRPQTQINVTFFSHRTMNYWIYISI